MADDRKKKSAPAEAKPAAKARAKPAPKPAAARAAPKPAAKPAARAAKAAAPRKAAAAKAPAGKKPPKSRTVKSSARPGGATAPAGEGPPGAEGYFVARVRGEDAAREAPHPLTENATDALPSEQATLPEEDLGELPWGYGDDTFMALPRDPRTLFLFWDFSAETTRRAFAGLPGGRAELRILARAGAGWEEVRRVDFALESRGFYVHDLEPGRVYRAEIHAIGKGGEDRTVGQPTNDMMLPPLGPSPVIDDRFIRIPWDMPLGRLLGPGHAGSPFSDEARSLLARLSDWSRFGTGGGSAGGIGGALGARGPGLGSGSGSGFGGGSGAGRGP